MAKRLSGTLNVGDFTVGHGETFVLDADVDVRATGDIMVFGRIVSDAKTAPGSSLRLHTTQGNILIAGQLGAAPGVPGDTPPVSVVVLAGDGRRGGALEIASDNGFVLVLQEAKLESGPGGSGGDAQAAGTGADAALVKAVSGIGGAGGPITISAGDLMIIEGLVKAGAGGRGGEAKATGLPADAPRPDGDTMGQKPVPLPSGFPAVVEATGRAGGPGGDVTVATTTKAGLVQLLGKVRGGTGGNSMLATAAGAKRATAYLETGGRGGNVAITLVESTLAIQVPGKGEIAGGTGGDCGDTSPIKFPVFDPTQPPVFFVDCALATATEVALAWVGYPAERGKPAGGFPGDVTATAVWSGPAPVSDPIKLNVTQSEAGDSTGAIAEVGTRQEHEWGADSVGAVPGSVMKVEVP